MKKYRYITIRQIDNETFKQHPVYRIFNNKSNAQLGILSYYPQWKQYIFSSYEDVVYDETCLRDILNFLHSLKEA